MIKLDTADLLIGLVILILAALYYYYYYYKKSSTATHTSSSSTTPKEGFFGLSTFAPFSNAMARKNGLRSARESLSAPPAQLFGQSYLTGSPDQGY